MMTFHLNETGSNKTLNQSAVSTTTANSVPSPFNDERILSGFLADYYQLFRTTSTIFLPAGEWFRQKRYAADELVNGSQRLSVQIDFEPDTRQVHQYVTRFSALQSEKRIEILTVEYDPVTKLIILAGSDG